MKRCEGQSRGEELSFFMQWTNALAAAVEDSRQSFSVVLRHLLYLRHYRRDAVVQEGKHQSTPSLPWCGWDKDRCQQFRPMPFHVLLPSSLVHVDLLHLTLSFYSDTA